MPLVEIENLTKSYRKGAQEVPVLRDLNLAVEAGSEAGIFPADETTAVAWSAPPRSTRIVTVTGTCWPAAIPPRLQTTVGSPEHEPWPGVADSRDMPDGSSSVAYAAGTATPPSWRTVSV